MLCTLINGLLLFNFWYSSHHEYISTKSCWVLFHVKKRNKVTDTSMLVKFTSDILYALNWFTRRGKRQKKKNQILSDSWRIGNRHPLPLEKLMRGSIRASGWPWKQTFRGPRTRGFLCGGHECALPFRGDGEFKVQFVDRNGTLFLSFLEDAKQFAQSLDVSVKSEHSLSTI